MAQYQQRTQPMHRGGGEAGTMSYGAKSVVGAATPVQQSYYRIQQHTPLYTSQPIAAYRGDGGYRGAGEYGRPVNGRMSLLPSNYLQPPAPPPPPPSDPPPFKKIRLSAEHHNAQHQQLRVDTRDSMYASSEQLSPNLTDLTLEEQSYRTTKDELLQQISKVDREMALNDISLSKLKRKAEELEKSASKPPASAEPEAEIPRHRSLEQSIYLENRKKAREAHAIFEKLGLNNQWPLYNQPQDTDVYRENKIKHRAFRPKLLAYMRRTRAEKAKRDEKLAEAYTKRLLDWRQRVERIESSQKRRAKDAKNREFFEKVFPELRKQREDRERFNRVGARVKSEADFEEIVDGLQEQEMEDKKMRSYAVVPPLLLESCVRKAAYRDTNGRCWDMEAEHRDLKHHNVWAPHEKDIFKEKFLQHPKNFGAISSYLDRKSVRDSVRFYYLTKKTENYKQLLKRNRARPTKRGSGRGTELGGGPQTRQRARGGDKEPESTPDPTRAAEADPPTSEIPCPRSPSAPISSPAPEGGPSGDCPATMTTTLGAAAIPTPPPPTAASPTEQQQQTGGGETRIPTPGPATAVTATTGPSSTPPLNSTLAVSTVPSTVTEDDRQADLPVATTTAAMVSVPPATTAVVNTFIPSVLVSTASVTTSISTTTAQSISTPIKTPEPSLSETLESAVAKITASAGNPSCGVCGISVDATARTVGRARAHHYGLSEAVGQDARVCEGCHAACVRGRFARCPLASCAGPRVRAKRLRLLPPRWHELPMHIKQPILEEFQIPAELSKCCLACSKRIVKRIETVAGPAPEPNEEEINRFRTLLREHGTDWAMMSQTCSRPPAYLKAFYFTHRRRHSLDTAGLTPHSDSSCVESGTPSPPPPPAPPPVSQQHHNDSSATETADEESETPQPQTQHQIQQQQPPRQPHQNSTQPHQMPTQPHQMPSQPHQMPTQLHQMATQHQLQTKPQPPPQQHPPPNTPTATITVREMLVKVIEGTFKATPMMSAPSISRPTNAAPRDSHVTLTVVDGATAHHPTPRSPHRPATITPVPIQQQQAAPPPQAQSNDNTDQESLLDLSVRKPRVPGPFAPPTRPAPPSQNQRLYQPPPETYYPRQPYPKYQVKPPLQPKHGSIMHGTPVSPEPEPKVGSITAGTPVGDKRTANLDHIRKASPGSRYPRSHNYDHEQRQIIMVDYLTSQQMVGGSRSVIQRGPGGGGDRCDALNSLANIAIQQPTLPVPQSTLPQSRLPQSPHPASSHTHSPHGHSPHNPSPLGPSHGTKPHQSPHQSPHPQQEHYLPTNQDRFNRDYAYNYHQAMENHRRAQLAAATQIQAGREREQQHRAMVAKQIRGQQMMEHQQQIIDRHHNMQQHAQVSSGATSVVVTDDSRRYTLPSRVVERKEVAPPIQQPQQNVRVAQQPRMQGTLTAASLIDAIIHHQITQTPCDPPPTTRQYSYVRDGSTGMINSVGGVNVTTGVTMSGPNVNSANEPKVISTPGVDEPHHVTQFKLGDLASDIITRDFNTSSLMQVRHNDIQRRYQNESSYASSNPAEDWKRSREPPSASKHAPYIIEPVSPPENHPHKRPSPSVGIAPPTSTASSAVRGYNANNRNLNAFDDFVATRIVEAMRSDTKETGFTTGTYYPYSALTVPVGEAPPPPVQAPPPPHAPPPPEPAPLMSAQYEPLSDED